KAYGELIHAIGSSAYIGIPPVLRGVTVPAENPFNPFGVPVAVHRLMGEFGSQRQLFKCDLVRTVLGIKGAVGVWDWDMAITSSEESAQYRKENELDMLAVEAALAATEPGQALDLFNSGSAGDPALLGTLRAN